MEAEFTSSTPLRRPQNLVALMPWKRWSTTPRSADPHLGIRIMNPCKTLTICVLALASMGFTPAPQNPIRGQDSEDSSFVVFGGSFDGGLDGANDLATSTWPGLSTVQGLSSLSNASAFAPAATTSSPAPKTGGTASTGSTARQPQPPGRGGKRPPIFTPAPSRPLSPYVP
jgi:hypothetical protein